MQPRPLAFALAHCALALALALWRSLWLIAQLCFGLQGDRVGAEVERQSDFMTVLLENCGAEVFLVEMAMTAANQAADRVQLEMGGEAMQSKRPGKMLLSATNGKVVVCCHVPEAHHTVHATAEEWMQSVLAVSSATQVLRRFVRAHNVFPPAKLTPRR